MVWNLWSPKDSGVWDISALVINGSGLVQVQRVDRMVTLAIRALTVDAAGSIQLLPGESLPHGLRPTISALPVELVDETTSAAFRGIIATNGSLSVSQTLVGTRLSGTVTYPTTPALPATFPGVKL